MSVENYLEAIVEAARGVLLNQWQTTKKDLKPYLESLSRAAFSVQQKLLDGTYTQQQADFALHGQELAINQFFLYTTVLTYATAQAILNAVMKVTAQMIQTATGVSLSWL